MRIKMPIYEYSCPKCGKVVEEIRPQKDICNVYCTNEECNKYPMEKLLSSCSFKFSKRIRKIRK